MIILVQKSILWTKFSPNTETDRPTGTGDHYDKGDGRVEESRSRGGITVK